MIRIKGTLHEDQHTFFISHLILLKMRNISDTHSMFNDVVTQNHAFHEIMWKKKNCTTGQATDDNMAHVRCIAAYLRLQTHTQNT